jgi:hypothetical protein
MENVTSSEIIPPLIFVFCLFVCIVEPVTYYSAYIPELTHGFASRETNAYASLM